jgi:hypothetical protein
MAAIEKEHAVTEVIDGLVESIQAGKSKMVDGNYGWALDGRLHADGWENHRTFSRCKVASFESHLKKDGRTVEIIVSCCMGTFTQVTVGKE